MNVHKVCSFIARLMMKLNRKISLKTMKKTCQTLSILLLSGMSCFATPGQEESPKPNVLRADQSAVLLQSLPSTDALPLLSCMGAGMALGGLISARCWNRRNK
jgi:hypothetical protein